MSEHFISRADAEADLFAFATYKAEAVKSGDGHASAMASIVPIYLAKDEVDLAAELANTVDDPFTRDRLLIATAVRCGELDDDEYAFQLIDSIDDPGLLSEGLERFASSKAARGHLDVALRAAERLDHPDPVYAAIAVKERAISSTAFEEAIGRINDPAIRVQAFLLTAVEALSPEAADNAVAAELLGRAQEEAGAIEDTEERIRSLIETGNILVDADRRGNAIEALDRALGEADELDNVRRDGYLAAISVAFLRAGSQDLSDRALDLVGDKTQLSSALVGHARIYKERGEADDATESLDEAFEILRSQKESETRRSPERFKLFGTIAAQTARFGDAERAIRIADGIEDDDERIAALSQVAAVLASENMEGEANLAANLIQEPSAQAFVQIAMSDSAANGGNAEAAKAFLDAAFSAADTVPQPVSRSSALIEVAARYFKFGNAEKGREAADLGFETIFTLKDESSLVSLICELGKVFAANGLELSDAQKTVMQRHLGLG